MLNKFTALFAAVVLTLWAGIASAQSEYRAKSGDMLVVEVLEDSSLNRSVVILPDGRFSFPFAGTLTGAGRTVGQIEAAITAAIASNFAAPPTVFVSVQPDQRRSAASGSSSASRGSIDVYFLGEVGQPGLRKVDAGTTFLQAMAQAGGLTKFAATKRIQLRRAKAAGGEPSVQTFNLKAISRGASLSNDPVLRDGDVILVPERRLFE